MKSLLCLKVDARGCVSECDRDSFFRDQLKVSDNCTCFDCGSRNPTWISLSFSVYICLNCSGKHRQLGTHISFVRSIDMDMFTPKQLVRLQLGGNRRALAYFSENYLSKKPYDYMHHKAQAYTRTLDKAVNDVISGSSEANLLFGQEDTDLERIKDNKDVKLDDLFDMVTSEATTNATTDNIFALNLDLKDSFMAKSKPSPFSGGLKREGTNKPTFKSRFSSKAALDIDAFEKALKEVKGSCTLDQTDEIVPPPSTEATYGGVEKQNDEFCGIDNRNVSEAVVNPPNLDHLKGMSGISSDVFFGRTEKQPISYNTFNPNRTSLSSDEYFGRAPRRTPNDSSISNPWNNLEDQALQNINELKDGLLNVIHKGNAIVEKAKLWLNTSTKF